MPVAVVRDEPLAKGHQRRFAEQWRGAIETIEDQLPAPIHRRRLYHLIIRDVRSGLQQLMMPEETSLEGLSSQVLHAIAHAVAGAQPRGGDANLAAPSKPKKQSRRDRLSSSLPPEWKRVRQELLATLCELRIEQEPAPYSPDLSRAALFARPSRADVPPPPRGAAPDPLDRSEDAESWRAQMAAHVEAQRQRQTYARARRLRPGNTWRNLHALGERGGKRPGLQAWPGQWSSYLLRLDSD